MKPFGLVMLTFKTQTTLKEGHLAMVHLAGNGSREVLLKRPLDKTAAAKP